MFMDRVFSQWIEGFIPRISVESIQCWDHPENSSLMGGTKILLIPNFDIPEM